MQYKASPLLALMSKASYDCSIESIMLVDLIRLTVMQYKASPLLALISKAHYDCNIESIVLVAETPKCWLAELQSRAAQALLSRLAALPHVSLVASFDHVDTPVLWDSFTAARFNWRLHDVTTCQPQLDNLVQAGVAPAVTVARSVLRLSTAIFVRPCYHAHLPSHSNFKAESAVIRVVFASTSRKVVLFLCRARQATEESAALAMTSFPHKARTIFCVLAEKQREAGSLGGENAYVSGAFIRDVYMAMSWLCSSIDVSICRLVMFCTRCCGHIKMHCPA